MYLCLPAKAIVIGGDPEAEVVKSERLTKMIDVNEAEAENDPSSKWKIERKNNHSIISIYFKYFIF